MSDKASTNEPNLKEMQIAIKKAGGLFYQYRPCRRDVSTIYDIENIRHGVLYAQTPLHMNDPFDSMIGFSAEEIYNEGLTMIVDAIEVDEDVKQFIKLLLLHKAFGKMGQLLQSITELEKYIKQKQLQMHQSHLPYDRFVLDNAKALYSKLPKKQKNIFVYQAFVLVAKLIGQLEGAEITEEELLSLMKLDELLEELHTQTIKLQSETYVPKFQKFLSTLTISCFSASGWDNQLMWSHYANSYSGICVEYDFSRINSFIGFIYPVNYTNNRPTISLHDLGIAGIDAKNGCSIIQCEININNIFTYLLAKNKCWNYEKEWRIINIGEENTPLFIDMPYIKSITFGPKIDSNCKRLLLDVCAEKKIECYELVLSKETFTLSREPIDLDDLSYDEEEEIEYIKLLFEHVSKTSELSLKSSDTFNEGIDNNEFKEDEFKNMLSCVLDLLSDSYYIKSTLNRICKYYNEELSKADIPDDIVYLVESINTLVFQMDASTSNLGPSVLALTISGKVFPKTSLLLMKRITDVRELIDRIRQLEWNHYLINACKNSIQVIDHYDTLVYKNNDPVHDPALLKEYMNKWDGDCFIEDLQLSSDKSVLEIGVGTGRLAVRVAPNCGRFVGIDVSPKTIERARENLAEYKNVELICDDFLTHEFDGGFDVIYSSLTFMHIEKKQDAISKIASLLNAGGRFVLSIDNNREKHIDTGTRKIEIYPDNPEDICSYLEGSGLVQIKRYETEFAYIFVSGRQNKLE